MAGLLSFDGCVALVTGGGRGLGRAYAKELAARKASVVINDVGCSVLGESVDSSVAENVAHEIRRSGGSAIANADDVSFPSGARAAVDAAIRHFGRLDIAICNAGITERSPFHEVTAEQYAQVDRVNHLGTAFVAMYAWPCFLQQRYGRLVMTSSVAGIWGRPGLSAYSASKAAVIGLARTLAYEAGDLDIKVNVISPAAASRMTDDRMQSDLGKHLTRAELSSALVTVLAHQSCPVSAQILQTFAGQYIPLQSYEPQGLHLNPNEDITAEQILSEFDKINCMTELRTFNHPSEVSKVRFQDLAACIGDDAHTLLAEVSENNSTNAPAKPV